ncbi:CBS domain-containing protein [Actinoplanes sp. NPDC048967]|uniref:CBS domain-containing protein n=1 Tax=Actinoplanes sp. NPDC048967 TaxID=3155269 RepID=UPI0033F6DE53
MKTWHVDDVMTKDVVTVREGTPYRDIVGLLLSRRVSALPVVDDRGRLAGLVSEADLLHKVGAAGRQAPRMFDTWRRHTDRVKARGHIAVEVMTWPVVTAEPSLTLAAAARRMHREHVRRLPVVDSSGRLVGIVTRSDLLKVHRRTDAEIRHDVVEQALHHVMAVKGATVRVECVGGVVILAGRVRFRSTAELIAQVIRQVPGVVDVADGLGFDVDDSLISGSRVGTPFGVV